jgi:GT2 family glycosyltransferase
MLERLAPLPIDEVLIVDNGSTSGLGEILVPFERVRVLEPGKNVGVAGRNLAAREAGGDLLLMLDDDVYPLAGVVERALDAFAANPKLAVLGGFVRDIDADGHVTMSKEVGTFDWFLRAGRNGAAPPGGFPAFFFPEGASFVRRSAFLEVGGFFEPFHHACEGIELTARLLGAGWDVRYEPTMAFDHRREAGRQKTQSILYYRIRNQLWYFWLRFPSALAARRIAAYGAFDFVESSYRGELGTWWRAVRDAWADRDTVRAARTPLPREVLRRAELNRGRMHLRLLGAQLAMKLRLRR